MKKSFTVAITGASGVQYGIRLLQVMAQYSLSVFCVLSDASRVVLRTEYHPGFPAQNSGIKAFLSSHLNQSFDSITFLENDDWFSPVASGSGAPDTMVVCPCSMGTLSAIATGSSNSLLERAADVVIKERGNLILVPREAPFSCIHLRHMLTLSEMGACILPASPSFYSQPDSVDALVDTVVQRVLDQMRVNISLIERWGQNGG